MTTLISSVNNRNSIIHLAAKLFLFYYLFEWDYLVAFFQFFKISSSIPVKKQLEGGRNIELQQVSMSVQTMGIAARIPLADKQAEGEKR